ncbi:2Fe-2S iron-sulfur cluster-binding protein [Streptomyces sp. LHD-70]|uniref:2Fe-2S iron-sulfur cluster-binding protein n=1 Tax=Streptomyces sp. LHD-70 TaxID=3072140 RepID=UPI00280C9096|nr:2Fe-2S iron-sulfur cluster-binding protein [Streptomyces sp. LHD-70]MDQ8705762.1 2Fe-2S iron-sulfur cluster-binding protein [Streptomyces sp. LHD-70]
MSDTNGNTGGGVDHNGGGWQPTPQGEYDADATAFVQIPEGFGLADFEESGTTTPLAAPGGYVPPQISVTGGAATDPAATSAFVVPTMGAGPAQPAPEQVSWPEPQGDYGGYDGYGEYSGYAGQEPSAYQDPSGYGQQPYEEFSGYAPQAPQAPHTHDNVTGQWSIPLAQGELPDESGEFTQSSLIEQWGGEAPATLPGGAPAPWAASVPEPAPEPVAPVESPAETTAEFGIVRDVPPVEATAAADAVDEVPLEVPVEAPVEVPLEEGELTVEPQPQPQPQFEPEPAPAAEADPAPDPEPEPDPVPEAAPEPDPVPEAAPAPAPEPVPEPEPRPVAAPETTPAVSSTQEQPAVPHDEHPLASYVLRVNGVDRPVTDAWIGESLLYVLRERLGLAGAKDGCSQGECGACAVQVDGRLVASCLVPAATAAGSEVRTVEGLATDGRPSDVQRALACGSAVQCGFCVPGMAMTVHDLLEGNPDPSEREARQALCGNLCRCSGYRGVLDAVREVVAERRAATEGDRELAGGEAESADGDAAARIPHQAPPGAGGVHPQHVPHQGAQDGGAA